MTSTDVISFEEAVADSDARAGRRSVLLGNGFSIGWNYSIFHYASLFEEADFERLSVDKVRLFDELNTRDFEKVIEHLESAASLADLYDTIDDDLAETLRADAQVIRHGLGEVIAKRHPNRANELSDNEVECARAFLANFRRIFTANYDLLLYWVVNRDKTGRHIVPVKDGFEWPTANGPYELIWKRYPTQGTQRIFYLHGALHFFVESDKRLHKLAYDLADPLIEQIREYIESGRYPRIVTEGRSDEKLAVIDRSAYLRNCRRKLAAASGSLFVYGMSLSANDDHILELIEAKESNIEALYISVYGDPDNDTNDELMRRARKIKRTRSRNGGRRLDLTFYDAASAHVWR